MARGDLVVWTGPVAKFQVPGATVPGATELFLQCRGDKGNWLWCPAVGDSLVSSPQKLLEAAGVSSAKDVFMGAFSAGGSVLKRLLETQPYRAVTTAVLLSDATYTASWVDAAKRIPPAIEGFVRYGVDVATGPGDKLFVATASVIPNKSWASGVENLQAIRHEIERRVGTAFVKRTDFFGVEPAPAAVWQLGNVILAEYPPNGIGHGHTKIAPQVWQKILLPWLDKGKGPLDVLGGLVPPGQRGGPDPDPSTGPSTGFVALLGVLAGAGIYFARRFFRRRQW